MIVFKTGVNSSLQVAGGHTMAGCVERPDTHTEQGPSWGYLKSPFSKDLVDFWR
jgi:hypothetical protein